MCVRPRYRWGSRSFCGTHSLSGRLQSAVAVTFTARAGRWIEATLTLAGLTDCRFQLPGPARTKCQSIAVDETIDPGPGVRALLDVIEVGFEGGAVDAATIDRFAAFLSGFMAEDAFATIKAAGKRSFNTREDEAEKPPDHAPSGPNLPVVAPETLAAEPDPPTES